ncbi:MAG: maltotransferase domain-containing protein, partial [Actinopolymorphaceae bacterium]
MPPDPRWQQSQGAAARGHDTSEVRDTPEVHDTVRDTTGEDAPRTRPPLWAADTVMGRIPIVSVDPVVRAGGQFPAKAVVGEAFTVAATIFREGHDALGANVVVRAP